MDQFNFKPSKLFKATKIVHPVTILSVFNGYPVPPENKAALIALLDFLLGTNTPHDLLTPDLIKERCQKVSPYLKECFFDLYHFNEKNSADLAKNLNNPAYKLCLLNQVEFTFGAQLGVIKMNPDCWYQNKLREQKKDTVHPLDAILNAYHPTQLFHMPKFLPPFYLHKDIKPTDKNEMLGTTPQISAKL